MQKLRGIVGESVRDATTLRQLRDERRSVATPGCFGKFNIVPAAVIMNYQFDYLARMLSRGHVRYYHSVESALVEVFQEIRLLAADYSDDARLVALVKKIDEMEGVQP